MSVAGVSRYAWWMGVAVALAAPAAPSRADHQPAIVKPNPGGLPPLVDGFDATGAIIEGDWGLYRPGTGQRMIYFVPRPYVPARTPPGYFPMTGRPPRSGRQEVDPAARRKPAPAQSYYRSWSAESSGPVTTYAPYDLPTVIEAAPYDRPRRPWPRPRPRLR